MTEILIHDGFREAVIRQMVNVSRNENGQKCTVFYKIGSFSQINDSFPFNFGIYFKFLRDKTYFPCKFAHKKRSPHQNNVKRFTVLACHDRLQKM